MTIKKILTAISVASVLAVSMVAIPASAAAEASPLSVNEPPIIRYDTFLNGEVVYSLCSWSIGYDLAFDGSTKYKNKNLDGKVYIAIDMVDSATGELVARCERREGTNDVSAQVHHQLGGRKYTGYSAHEVIIGNYAWGDYIELAGQC